MPAARSPVRPPAPPLLLICGHFLERFQRSFEARRRAVNGSRYWDRLQKYSGVFRFVHLDLECVDGRRRWRGGCKTPSCETELRLASPDDSVSEHFARMETDARAGPLMHVDWLRFGGRSILGQSKRSGREIYGFTTVKRTDGMRSVISDLHHRCLKRGLRHERVRIVQQEGHN